jgi:hypothetical protein
MTFLRSNIETVNVVIGRSLTSVNSFIEGEPPDSDNVLLSTANGTLISLDHGYGVGAGDQSIVIRFADSGGDTLQKIFSLDISSVAERAKYNPQQAQFVIRYGFGSDQEGWSSPGYFYLYAADYDVLTDGLEITQLTFTPNPRVDSNIKKAGKPSSDLGAVRRAPVLKSIGTWDTATNKIDLYSNEKIIQAIKDLYKEEAQNLFGLPAYVAVEDHLFLDYINRSVENPIEWGDSRTKNVKGFRIAKGFDQGTFTPDMVDGQQLVLYGDGGTRLRELITLFELPGIQITTTKADTTVPEHPSVNEMKLSTYLEGMDATDKAAASWNPVSLPDEGSDRSYGTVSIHLSHEYAIHEKLFKRVFQDLIKSLVVAGSAATDPTAKTLEGRVFIQNSGLEGMINDKLLDEDEYKNTSVVFLADTTTLVNKFKKYIDIKELKSVDDYLYKPTSNVDPKELDISLILKTQDNLLSFRSTSKIPSIAYFKNKLIENNTTGLTEDQKKEYIRSTIKSLVTKYGHVTDPSKPFDPKINHNYDWALIAHELYGAFFDEDKKPGEYRLSSNSQYGGLLEFLLSYYNHAVLGTILAEVTATPQFQFSNPLVIGYNAYVEIIKNPSTYENIDTKVLDELGLSYPINSYHSGIYKIVGFKHSITNSSAISVFSLQKISIGV